MKIYRFGSRLLNIVGVGVSLLILAGCTTAYQPKNRIIPSLSFCQRIQKCEQDCEKEHEQIDPKCKKDRWIESFDDELKEMDAWAPPKEWFDKSEATRNELKKQIKEIALEYGLDLPDDYYKQIFNELGESADYFFKEDAKTDPPREGRENLKYRSRSMLSRIDKEHPTLLVEGDLPSCREGPLPRMVSNIIPAGVSLAVIHPKEEPKAKDASPSQIVINCPSEKSQSEENKQSTPAHCQIMINGIDAAKAKETPKVAEESLVSPIPDFQPVQNITLTLSTVLNSADTLDRLDYVSTFIYIYPYQKPPNGQVDLDMEFWRNFFSCQAGRIQGRGLEEMPKVAKDAIGMDLRHSFDMMRTYFRDVQTMVVLKDLDFGTITRNTTDSIGGGISASIPAYGATVNPSLNFKSEETSTTVTKLLRQLDQRSAYIAPDTNFLRITQRGMINVNLAGRINEQVQLYVPAAKKPITAIVPKENNKTDFGILVKPLAQPLYARIDAVVVSLAVVRHPTKLRPTKHENFGLPNLDIANSDFIVGVPWPSQVTLFKWERMLDHVVAAELAPTPNFPMEKNELIYFDSESSGIHEAVPLVLAGFSNTLASALRAKISQEIDRSNKKPSRKSDDELFNMLGVSRAPGDSPGSYYILVQDNVSGTIIRLGLLDEERSEEKPEEKPKLKAFDAIFFERDKK